MNSNMYMLQRLSHHVFIVLLEPLGSDITSGNLPIKQKLEIGLISRLKIPLYW